MSPIEPKSDDQLIADATQAFEAGRFDEAVTIYSKLIQDHEISELYNQRGLAYRSAGNMNAAQSDFTKAIELSPSDPDCYVNRANISLQLKFYQDALADYDIALSLSPKSPIALNGRGYTKFKIGDISGAFDDLWSAVEIDNSYLSPIYNLGLVCKAMGKPDEARTYFKKALKIDPNDSDSLRELSRLERSDI